MSDRLYRSKRDRMIAGVAGGLAEMWAVDPSLIRIVWAILIPATGGVALVVYIVMAIVVPEEDELFRRSAGSARSAASTAPVPEGSAGSPSPGGPDAAPGVSGSPSTDASPISATPRWSPNWRPPETGRVSSSGAAIGGAILIVIGVFFLARQYIPEIDFDLVWPLILIGVGGLLLILALTRRPGGGGDG